MNTQDFKRKLTAVFSADVAGYSRLMGEDEAATVKTLEAYKQIMFSLIKQHRGRVIDSPGDNILAEFASVVDAVQGSVAIQKELQARNADLPENRKMQFRIGINLGDVIEEQDRIYGDGVNIAARLESCADPGGICVSKTAFDHIETKLPLGYEYLGEKEVKNIAKPVGTYRVLMEPRVTVAGAKEKKPSIALWRKKGILLGAGAVIVVIILVAVWNLYWRAPKIEPASKEKMAFLLPDKPSIAVLPFANMTGDPTQEFLSDGVTENIITVLSGVPQLFVIARHSTFVYKGRAVKVQQVAEDLGVRYVLEGSIARSGDRIRVTAQLIDALKGHHLWSERYDRELKDLFTLQDDLAKNILAGIGLKLTHGEGFALGSGPRNIEVWLKLLQAGEYLRAFNIDGNNRARLIAEECIKLEPDFWGNYVLLGSVYMMDYYLGSTKNPAKSLQMAIEYLEKAAALSDDSKGRVYPILGNLYAMKKDYGKAVGLGEEAIAIVPNGADAHAWLAMSLTFAGRAEEAIPLFEKAMRLNPLPPAFYYLNFGHAYRSLGRFEEAITMYKKTASLTPNNIFAYIGLAGIYGMMGREEEAKAAGAEVLHINPKWSIEYFAKTVTSLNKEGMERFIEGLRRAGLPEKPPLPLPDKPSIAVLPFVNMSEDKSQEYFSDGLTEEIITALSKTPKLFVIARNSSFVYKGKPVKVQQVSRELGVKYVLEGSVRRSGDQLRMTAQLVDAATGNHLWAERYDRQMKDIFALQDEITMKILIALQIKLTEGEQARVYGKGTHNLEAYLLCLQAEKEITRLNKDGLVRARQMVQQAITLDPGYARAYHFWALTYVNEVILTLTREPKQSLATGMELEQKALALDNSLSYGHALLGWLYTLQGQHDKGITECEQAIALEPNSAAAYFYLSLVLKYAGRASEAIAMSKEAIRVDPIPVSIYYQGITTAYCHTGQYGEAIAAGKKAVELGPNNMVARAFLTVAYSLSGKEEEASTEAKEVMRINPKFSLDEWAKTMPYKNKADKELIIGALRKAGLK